MAKKTEHDDSPLSVDLDDPQLSEALSRFTLVADETRLRVLCLLSAAPSNMTDMCSRLGSKRPVIARHLSLLRVAGIIQRDRLGSEAFYSLTEPGWGLVRICTSLKNL